MNKLISYLKTSFSHDFFAGLTVSMIAIPQSMAYATIAGVEPVMGLYAAMLPALIAAIFGSSKYLVTGATNAISLTTASVLIAYIGMPDYPEYVFFVAFASGLLMLLMGVFNLNSLIRFISNSVLTAFLAGAGTLIIINQSGGLMGIERQVGSSPIETIRDLFLNLGSINYYVLGLSVISILILVFLKKITSIVPAAFVSMLVSGLIVWIFDWQRFGVKVISDISQMEIGLFHFSIPQVPFKAIPDLFLSAFAIAILALIQTISVEKPLAMARNERIVPRQDFLAQGAASMMSGLVGSIPTAGSLAQSAVNFDSGSKSKMAAVFSSIFVLLTTLFFSGLIDLIPTSCLSSIVIVSAIRLIDFKHIKQTWNNSLQSKVLLIFTYVMTILLPLQKAVFVGAGLSIFFYLYGSKNVKLTYLRVIDNKIHEMPLNDLFENSEKKVILNVEGSMYFGSADVLESQIDFILENKEIEGIIFYMRSIHSMASTMTVAFVNILRTLQLKGIDVYVCGIAEDVREILINGGILKVLNEEKVVEKGIVIFDRLIEIYTTKLLND